ncbi:MAG: hypothetical protein IJV08_05650 [Bacteroidaceae bacterium]|nr:hypothetical protein [Bacteroidaceae bacterium]
MKKFLIILFSVFFYLQFSQAADLKEIADSGDKNLIAIRKQSLQLSYYDKKIQIVWISDGKSSYLQLFLILG